jgi:hypothetical protein
LLPQNKLNIPISMISSHHKNLLPQPNPSVSPLSAVSRLFLCPPDHLRHPSLHSLPLLHSAWTMRATRVRFRRLHANYLRLLPIIPVDSLFTGPSPLLSLVTTTHFKKGQLDRRYTNFHVFEKRHYNFQFWKNSIAIICIFDGCHDTHLHSIY